MSKKGNEFKVLGGDVGIWVDMPLGNGAYLSEKVALTDVLSVICSHLGIHVVYEPGKLRVEGEK